MIKRAKTEDAEALAGLAIQMWTDHNLEDLEAEFRELAMNNEAACFIKYVDGVPIAFAQCQLSHDYVEGTESSPVGYLEGIFVSEGYRRMLSEEQNVRAVGPLHQSVVYRYILVKDNGCVVRGYLHQP